MLGIKEKKEPSFRTLQEFRREMMWAWITEGAVNMVRVDLF